MKNLYMYMWNRIKLYRTLHVPVVEGYQPESHTEPWGECCHRDSTGPFQRASNMWHVPALSLAPRGHQQCSLPCHSRSNPLCAGPTHPPPPCWGPLQPAQCGDAVSVYGHLCGGIDMWVNHVEWTGGHHTTTQHESICPWAKKKR